MRAIYLIARREYLSYVATWGFWLSLLSVPFFMALGFGLPGLIEGTQPARYYAIVDETGRDYAGAIQRAEMEERRAEIRAALRAAAELTGREDRLPAAFAALDAQPGLDGVSAAAETLGVPAGFDIEPGRYRRVDAPARDPETLRAYLLGERKVETPDGESPLFAAIILRPGGEAGVSIDYWSANLTDSRLQGRIRAALRTVLRDERLAEAGVPAETVRAVRALDPDVRELNPEREAAAAEVTVEERLPLYMGIVLAFMLWTVIFSVVNMLLTAMIEEKGAKILEMLLASARHHEILVGKLLGVAAVSFTLLVFWGGLGAGMLLALQQLAVAADLPVAGVMSALFDPALLLPALGYFVIGYLMFGAVFLAIGSLCDTLQEAQTLMGPIFLVMMVPLFIVMTSINNPDSVFLAWASWVPLWTPFLMMARLPAGVPMAEILATTGLMVATAVLVTAAAGGIFRLGALGRANASSAEKFLKPGRKRKAANAKTPR